MAQGYQELVKELNQHRLEVSKLRNELNAIDKEKESWFKKKDEKSRQIKELIHKIKDNKTKRDALTSEVKELKPKRDSINKGTSPKSAELAKLRKEKESVKSPGIRESPYKIKQDMEKLEFKIETEAISFSKEQQLMKKIKELRKLYDSASDIVYANKKIRDSAESIRKMRKESNEVHMSIQEKAKQSQALHEEILKMSSEIDRLKIEEQESFNKFSELKKKFTEANYQLKEKLKAMNDVKNSLDKISSDKKEKKKREIESFLKSKEEEVNQKLKRGEKLTTEDLLVFQSLKEK